MLTRRSVLCGLGVTVAMPFVCRDSGLLMPVRSEPVLKATGWIVNNKVWQSLTWWEYKGKIHIIHGERWPAVPM